MTSPAVASPLALLVLRSIVAGEPGVRGASAGLTPRGRPAPWRRRWRAAKASRAASAEPSMALWVRRRHAPVPSAADAWRVLDLEAELALVAWSSAPRADRRRAHRTYRDALAREAWAAALLAQSVDPAAGAG